MSPVQTLSHSGGKEGKWWKKEEQEKGRKVMQMTTLLENKAHLGFLSLSNLLSEGLNIMVLLGDDPLVLGAVLL